MLISVFAFHALVAASPVPTYSASEIEHAMTASRRVNWGASKRYGEYARLFVANGKRWRVNSVIVACVAYAESRYHVQAPKLMRKVCKITSTGCDRPGPCPSAKQTIKCRRRWVNNQEAGMMQVDNRYEFARNGYRECTGKRLSGGRFERMRKLIPPAVAVCVGTRALAIFRRWGKARRSRMEPRSRRNRRFFTSYPGLRTYFWVAYYNWGPNRRRRNGYPRIVTGCVRRYQELIRAYRAKRETNAAK